MSNQELINKYTERNQKIKQYIDNKVQPSTSTEGYDLTIIKPQTRIFSITFNETITLPTEPVQFAFDHVTNSSWTLNFDDNHIYLYYFTIYNNGTWGNDFTGYGWKWVKATRTLTFVPNEELPLNNSAKVSISFGSPEVLVNIGSFKGSLVDPAYATKLELGVDTGDIIETNGDNTLEVPLADADTKQLKINSELLNGDVILANIDFIISGTPSQSIQTVFNVKSTGEAFAIASLNTNTVYVNRYANGSYNLVLNGNTQPSFENDFMKFDSVNMKFSFKSDVIFSQAYYGSDPNFSITTTVTYVDKGLIDPVSNSLAIDNGRIEVKNPIPDGSNTNNYDVLCVNNGTPVWETMMGVVNFGDLNFYYDEEQGASFSLANFKAYLNYFNPNIPLIEIGEFEWWTELPDGFEFSVHKPEALMDGTIPASYLLHWPIEGDLTFDLDGGDRPHPSTRQYKFSYRIKMAEPGMVQMDIKCLQDIPAGTNFGNGKFRVDSCSYVQDRS